MSDVIIYSEQKKIDVTELSDKVIVQLSTSLFDNFLYHDNRHSTLYIQHMSTLITYAALYTTHLL